MTALTGTWGLVRLILRRDRVLTPLWVLVLGLVPISYVASIDGLFPSAAARQQYADLSAHNAGFVALYGRLHGSSLGELVAWRGGFIPVMAGLFCILTVIRHTRAEEDSGRRELLGSAVVGRHAPLAAALVSVFAAGLVLCAVLALGMIGQGLPAAGSWAFGAELAVTGWVFAAVAAMAAQLTAGAGSARAIAIGALAAAYVLRIVGDVGALDDGTPSWAGRLSPLEWVTWIRPYGEDAWWPVALTAGVAVALALGAAALSTRRDLGAGLLPPRLGRPAAGPALRSPLALAWRLHRGLLAGWAAGFAVLGVVLGYLAASVADLVRDAPQMADVFARLGGAAGLVDDYLAATTNLFGLIASAYAVQATLRARAEETSGRAEAVLGTAVGRLRWLGGHLAFSLVGPAAVLAAAGLAMGLAHGLNTGEAARQTSRLLAAALVQLPAVWVLAGVTVALYGLLPRLTALGWGAPVFCLLIGMVGAAIGLDQWVLDVSPFTHVPRLPADRFGVVPLASLSAIAAVLTAAGLAAFRRRDLPIP
ncbi:ABC transporter permease [Microbispora sp. GKU 823]|uniref:ABC transporter permease n=1 Tax=Microbispora sp. GKU 823 TaxID=1652100 RepID=UPI0009A359E3|nr:ABC transporter permease [Microbispora sp. GKU 823]OPG13816.1 ABC transporter permease [Microbispora sp. GKU 823]